MAHHKRRSGRKGHRWCGCRVAVWRPNRKRERRKIKQGATLRQAQANPKYY